MALCCSFSRAARSLSYIRGLCELFSVYVVPLVFGQVECPLQGHESYAFFFWILRMVLLPKHYYGIGLGFMIQHFDQRLR